MGLFENLKRNLRQGHLLREIKRRNPDYQPRPFHPEQAKRVALLFPADELADREAIIAYRDARQLRGLKTDLFGYFTTSTPGQGYDFHYFTVANLNWYGAPKGSEVEHFLSRECDLLLAFGAPGHPIMEYLAALKPAGLRVGPHTLAASNP
ncbi:MAG: hypothetical protein HC821_01385, partial [Lewinella sp.]|nr:hypothetical protein [Lewinella sp.]